MVYYNLVYHYGLKKFIKEANESGFDGLIIPDLPLEERQNVKKITENNNIYLIPLVAPTSKDRIAKVIEGAKGFIYCVSSNGTTGERSSLSADINEYLNTIKSNSNIPICLGFGISSREVVKKVKGHCDGVIIGSAVVRRLSQDREKAFEFIKDIKEEL